MGKVSLTAFQTVVGITAGLVTILGAAYSAVQLFGSTPGFGQVVAIVRDAKSGQPVSAATIEVLTPQDALVTTLTLTNDGRAHQTLREGLYRVRVSHPQFGAEVRQVQILPGQTAEVRFLLIQRAGGSSPIGQARRVVDEGVSAVERFFKSLGR